MKKCPQCQADYFDEQLEFCLEDGAKLTFVRSTATVADTKVFNTAENSVATAFFDPRAEMPQTANANAATNLNAPAAANETKVTSLKQNAVETGSRALEIGTLVIALANNWLQWLYIERQHYGTFTNFVFSVEFLFWLLLLFAGVAAGLLTLKLSRTKTLAYVGLVILAINFVLLLVPKK
jgi:hypothetical protein